MAAWSLAIVGGLLAGATGAAALAPPWQR